jgi:NDP-sugar pyrophosphorylase family protein
MQIVILAGGLGTRMRPYTDKIPKAMLPVNDNAFVDYQMTLFKNAGITDIVFCIGHMGEMLEKHIGNGDHWGIKVSYSWEREKLLGTGGALKNAMHLLDTNFLLTWGDSFVRADYDTILNNHITSGFPISVAVFKNQDKWDKSNIDFRDGKVVVYEKNSLSKDLKYIDAGLSAFDRDFLEEIPEGIVSLDKIWEKLSLEGRLGGIEIKDRFYEIGSEKGYKEFIKFSRSLLY